MTEAIKAACEFCQRTSSPWLVIAGAVGCGKTHICYAIANQMAKENIKCRYWTVPDLLEAIRGSYNPPQPSEEGLVGVARMTIEEMAYDPEILLLDDLGTQKQTDWVSEKLFEIIDRRYRQGKGLVVTTNEPMAQLSDRLQSRFMDKEMCRVIICNSPDFRPQLAPKPKRDKASRRRYRQYEQD